MVKIHFHIVAAEEKQPTEQEVVRMVIPCFRSPCMKSNGMHTGKCENKLILQVAVMLKLAVDSPEQVHSKRPAARYRV